MELPAPEFKEPLYTPPKLSLFSLPSKPPTVPDGITPPPNTVATIPFLWEEAPGKPRPTTTDDPPMSKIVRSLDLPPRLMTTAGGSTNNNVRIEIIPSPTTVLGGPYEGKSLSESPEKVVVSSNSNGKSKEKITMSLRKLMKKEGSPVKLKWRRWESFRDMDDDKVERSPPVKFCSWRWESFREVGGRNSSSRGGCDSLCSSFDDIEKAIDSCSKTGEVTRKNSFTFVNGTTSRFLASMYGTLKQALPWRSRK